MLIKLLNIVLNRLDKTDLVCSNNIPREKSKEEIFREKKEELLKNPNSTDIVDFCMEEGRWPEAEKFITVPFEVYRYAIHVLNHRFYQAEDKIIGSVENHPFNVYIAYKYAKYVVKDQRWYEAEKNFPKTM